MRSRVHVTQQWPGCRYAAVDHEGASSLDEISEAEPLASSCPEGEERGRPADAVAIYGCHTLRRAVRGGFSVTGSSRPTPRDAHRAIRILRIGGVRAGDESVCLRFSG